LRSARVPVLTKKRQRPDSRFHAPVGVARAAVDEPETASPAVYWLPRKKVDFYSFDAEYLRRLRARDSATEAHFYSYFEPRLKMKLRHRGLAPSTVEDISQDTFLRVLTGVQNGTVLHPERFGAYVSAVCDNLILEKYREFARNQHFDVDGMDVADGKTSLEGLVLLKEKRKIVAEILEQMPPKKRNILRAFMYEQLDREQMCARFGVKSDYLRVLLFRAREEFAALWKSRGPNL
jgi:RNA polymerase sigma-70 factor, ECF subfamily